MESLLNNIALHYELTRECDGIELTVDAIVTISAHTRCIHAHSASSIIGADFGTTGSSDCYIVAVGSDTATCLYSTTQRGTDES